LPDIVCGVDPVSVILSKQNQLSRFKRGALLRCLQLVDDLKHMETGPSSACAKQRSEEVLRARIKREELAVQLNFMDHQEDKLVKLDIELSDLVIEDIKATEIFKKRSNCLKNKCL